MMMFGGYCEIWVCLIFRYSAWIFSICVLDDDIGGILRSGAVLFFSGIQLGILRIMYGVLGLEILIPERSIGRGSHLKGPRLHPDISLGSSDGRITVPWFSGVCWVDFRLLGYMFGFYFFWILVLLMVISLVGVQTSEALVWDRPGGLYAGNLWG